MQVYFVFVDFFVFITYSKSVKCNKQSTNNYAIKMCEKRDFNRVNRTITTVAPIVYNFLIKIYTSKNVLGAIMK